MCIILIIHEGILASERFIYGKGFGSFVQEDPFSDSDSDDEKWLANLKSKAPEKKIEPVIALADVKHAELYHKFTEAIVRPNQWSLTFEPFLGFARVASIKRADPCTLSDGDIMLKIDDVDLADLTFEETIALYNEKTAAASEAKPVQVKFQFKKREFGTTFYQGPMGMGIAPNKKGSLVVRLITPGGPADSLPMLTKGCSCLTVNGIEVRKDMDKVLFSTSMRH